MDTNRNQSENFVSKNSPVRTVILVSLVTILLLLSFASGGIFLDLPKKKTKITPSPTLISASPTPHPISYIYNFRNQNATVFSIGGLHYNNQEKRETATNSAEFYSFKENKWHFAPPMTTERRNAAAAVVNDKIYVFGGINSKIGYENTLSTVEEFDPETNTWTFKNEMPTPRAYIDAVPLLGKIYILGGTTNASSHQMDKTVDVYDPITNSWSTAADSPTVLDLYSVSTCVPFEEKIYCPVFENQTKTLVYNPTVNRWFSTSLLTMGYDERVGGWASNDNSIYAPAFTGQKGNNILHYDPKDNSITTTQLEDYIHTTYREQGIVLFNSFMLMVGGRFSERPVRDVYLYGFNDFTSWMKTTPLNIGRASATTVVLHKVYNGSLPPSTSSPIPSTHY